MFAPGGFTIATTRSDGTFGVTKPANNVSVTATTATTSMDLNQPPGVFTVTRTGNTASQLPVSYTLTGTATNNVHYNLLSGTVTFLANETSKDINVTAIPFTPAGPTRSVILTLNSGSTAYTPVSPITATVWIVDTNKPALSIARRDTQFYERTNDIARFTLTRYGNTNVAQTINLTYGGTATAGVQYDASAAASVFMTFGEVTKEVQIAALHDGVVTGPLTVTATVAPAGDGSYVVGTPATSDPVTMVDSDDWPETVLWSDNLNTDSSANWTVLFATTNGTPLDYCLNATANPDLGMPLIGTWPFDYSALSLPAAPHSTDGSTLGLFMTVNKQDAILGAAALNLYPKLQSFSGNYALRFDMYLIQNSTSGTTEYALFGINHSGTRTNWFRNTITGFTGVDPVGWNFDGVFYGLESDGAALGDYVGYSSPTTANRNPTPITPGVNASTLTGVFKTPPWTPGAGNGGAAANVSDSGTPIWADVEIAQVNGVISWSINHTLIFAYTNTTGYTSGDIMLGYTDAYDSVGAAGGAVIYDNVRVIRVAGPVITSIVLNGGNVEITFTAGTSDVVGQFTLQQASPSVTGTYADTSSTITSLGGGAFKAVKAVGAIPSYYRIRKAY